LRDNLGPKHASKKGKKKSRTVSEDQVEKNQASVRGTLVTRKGEKRNPFDTKRVRETKTLERVVESFPSCDKHSKERGTTSSQRTLKLM